MSKSSSWFHATQMDMESRTGIKIPIPKGRQENDKRILIQPKNSKEIEIIIKRYNIQCSDTNMGLFMNLLVGGSICWNFIDKKTIILGEYICETEKEKGVLSSFLWEIATSMPEILFVKDEKRLSHLKLWDKKEKLLYTPSGLCRIRPSDIPNVITGFTFQMSKIDVYVSMDEPPQRTSIIDIRTMEGAVKFDIFSDKTIHCKIKSDIYFPIVAFYLLEIYSPRVFILNKERIVLDKETFFETPHFKELASKWFNLVVNLM